MTVFIRGLEFYAYHGVPDAEQEIGHRYRADIEFEVASTGEADELDGSADYARVAARFQTFCQGRQARTLEFLAREAADDLLAEFAPILAVVVILEKRLPPAAIIAESVGVRVRRERQG